MAGSVQFKGAQSVQTAYENMNCGAWAICQGSQFMFKFAGSTDEAQQALAQCLEMIGESTNAIYTLRVYEDIKDRLKIKGNTPYDGSFNFRLNEENQLITQSQYGVLRNNNELASRLAAIEKILVEREEDAEEEESETESALGKVGDIINHPVVLQLATMFGLKMPAAPAAPGQPGALGNISEGDQEQKIKNAVADLKTHDARLGDHLQKLAHIATSSKTNFDYLLNVLDNM